MERRTSSRHLEAASKNDPNRSAGQQKIGDYWAACMDEAGIEAAGLKPLQSELERIAALKSKKDITLEIARLHQHVIPAPGSPGTTRRQFAALRLHRTKDYDNASMVVAQIDQARTQPSQPRLLPQDRRQIERDACQSTARIFRRCWCWLANQKPRLQLTPER